MGGPGGGLGHIRSPIGKEGCSSFLMIMFVSSTLFGFIFGLLSHSWMHQCPAKRANLQQIEKTRSNSLVENVVEVCNRTMESKLHIVKNESGDAYLVYEILSCCIDKTENGCHQASSPTIFFRYKAPSVERK